MLKHFLLCSERSGSNLITKLLNAHSNICGPSTKHLMNPVFRNLYRYSPLEISENWKCLVKDVLNLYNVEFSIWKSSFDLEELLSNVDKGDYIGLVNYFFDKEAIANTKEIIFIKENHVYEFFPYLDRHYKMSKFLYQVRDPRDVALSWKKNPTHKGGVVNAARQWKKDQQQLLKLKHYLNEDNRVIALKYEDLILDTPKELKKVLDFFSLNYESSILDFHQDLLTKENASTQNAWNNLSKSVINDNSNKFLKELSLDEVKAIEKICGNEMQLLGYEMVNNKESLMNFLENDIEKINKEEQLIDYNPSIGVLNNMKAKTYFYQNLPNNL